MRNWETRVKHSSGSARRVTAEVAFIGSARIQDLIPCTPIPASKTC